MIFLNILSNKQDFILNIEDKDFNLMIKKKKKEKEKKMKMIMVMIVKKIIRNNNKKEK